MNEDGMFQKGSGTKPVVYKVIGAPGTGKTTRVVGNPELDLDGLFIENLGEYSFDDQMLVTYTNAGVDEAADRLSTMLNGAGGRPKVPKYKIDSRVTTIHGQCYRLLDLDREQVVQFWHKNKFCEAFDLEFGYESDSGDDIMAQDKKEGNALFEMYGWLKDNRLDNSQWEEYPNEVPLEEDPEWLMDRWDEWKESKGLVGFGDMIEKVVEWGFDKLRDEGLGVLFVTDDTTTREMFHKAREDHQREPSNLRGRGPFIDTKVLYVDEVQDLTPLQWEWYLLQKLVCEKVYIGGDDDQCLPPNAPIEVKSDPLINPGDGEKYYQKPIKDVNVGDLVRTMTSDGSYTYQRVSDVTKREVSNKRFKLFETESGRRIAVTDNHKMFARIPEADEDTSSNLHYVYLMRDNEGRWRIGETSNLRQRMNVERGARCIVPLESFDTKEEALLRETQLSLEYSIPQITIQQRDGEALADPKVRDELYNSINPDYDGVERRYGVDLRSPPFFKKGVTRGRTQSININIKMCNDMRGKKPRHRIMVYTSNEDAINKLRSIEELTESDGKGDASRFRTSSEDITELGSLANRVQELVGGDIITEMAPTEDRNNAVVTPAGNLIEGMKVPVTKDNEVVWEEIVNVDETFKSTEVYDLTVPGTHNFTTSGVGVHNTIYGWSGANPEFMLDEEGDFEVLEKTYRIPSNIWNICDGVIQQVDKRQEKTVEPHGDGGEFVVERRPSSRQLIEHLKEGEWMVLFRARYQIDEFRNHLHAHGIAYRNMSTFDTWSDDMVKLRDGLCKLEGNGEQVKGDELDAMMEHAEDDMLNHNSGVTESEKVMGMLGGISPDRLDDIFHIQNSYGKQKLTAQAYLNATDELNYYEKEALRGAVNNKTGGMNPDRIRIGTIHSSKGKEAPGVIVATDSTTTILDNMFDDPASSGKAYAQQGLSAAGVPQGISDAERRVYYVGMTRASEKLVLAEGAIDPETAVSVNTILGDGWEEFATETGKQTEQQTW